MRLQKAQFCCHEQRQEEGVRGERKQDYLHRWVDAMGSMAVNSRTVTLVLTVLKQLLQNTGLNVYLSNDHVSVARGRWKTSPCSP